MRAGDSYRGSSAAFGTAKATFGDPLQEGLLEPSALLPGALLIGQAFFGELQTDAEEG